MKQLLTLISLLLTAQLSSAQTHFSSVNFSSTNISLLTAETNQAGDVCIAAFTFTGTDFLILDKQGKKVSAGKYPYNFGNGSTVLGMIGLPDKFIYFDQAPDAPGTVQPYQIDRKTGQVIMLNSVVAVPDKNSLLTTAFSANGRFYALFLNKEDNILYLSIFKDEHAPEVRTYSLDSINDKQMYSRLVKRGELQLMVPGIDQNMYSNSALSKIYTSPDKLTITFDMFNNPDAPKYTKTTEILTLDLHQDKATFQKLPYLTIGSFNSYLHQNKVYRFIVSGKALELEVHDLVANKVLTHYSYSGQDTIGIMANTAVKRGTPNSWSPRPDSLVTTQELFSKLRNGIPAIAVDTLAPGKLQLIMGTYKVQESPNQTIAGAATRRAAVYGGPAALPLLLLGAALQGTASITMTDGTGISTSFKSILSTDSLAAVPGSLRKSIQEKMSDYERHLYTQKVKPVGALVYTYQGKTYFGYVDKKTKLLNLTVFTKE